MISIIFSFFGLLVFIPAQSVFRAQIPSIWCMGSLLPILAPKASMQVALRRHSTVSCPGAIGWWMGSCYCAKR